MINTKQNKTNDVKFKNLILFFVASSSILISGFIVGGTKDYYQLALLLWCNITGVFLVYRLNDTIDQNRDLKFNIMSFIAIPLHKMVVIQFLVIVIPLAFIYLNPFILTILSISASLGILYSINFKFGAYQFRLKNVFFVKNMLIGVTWGSLILIGATNYSNPFLTPLFVFVSAQVFLGGMIRDIPDLEKDKLAKVQSFPVVLGIPATVIFMHLINVGFTAYLISTFYSTEILLLFGVSALWRTMNIFLVGKNPANRKWSQSMNLTTCVLILLMLLIL